MPVMNGVDFCREIFSYEEYIHVTIISAYNDSQHYFEALQLGVHGYISKPLDKENFTHTIRSVVEKVHHHHEFKKQHSLLQKELIKKEQKEKLQDVELKFKSYHDDLTGITNRLKLENDLMILKNTDFIMIDIDGFSHVNSIYGSKVGDLLLIRFAEILSDYAINHSCMVYRVGADHFALLRYKKEGMIAYDLAKTLVEYFTSNTLLLHNEEAQIHINISITIGLSLNSFGHKIMEQAMEALKYAQEYSQSVVVYSESLGMENKNRQAFDAIEIVKSAIEEDRLLPFYQPIKKADSIAYESLVRIIDKKGQIITPNMFLPDIFHTIFYQKLTFIMIEKSFEYFSDKENSFSINLSYKDINNEDFLDWIQKKALHYKIADRLIIEIVESEYLRNFDLVGNFVTSMREMGVEFAIDDFGSAYSNFTYLLKLKPDYLKIDGSLVKDVDTNTSSFAIVKAISNFAKDLNIKTIAEFVHSESVYNTLQTLQIDGYQGYYIGKPLPTIMES